MEDQQIDFKPLEYSKTLHNKLRPPMFDRDHISGEDYVIGQLVSLYHAKDALLFIVRFTPGPDAESLGYRSLSGEVEFLLIRKKGRYLGNITRQNPEGFLEFSTGEDVSILDGLGHGAPGYGGRQAAHFWCSLLPHFNLSQRPKITVSMYIKLGWFGGWKEVVVELPKKELYVARL